GVVYDRTLVAEQKQIRPAGSAQTTDICESRRHGSIKVKRADQSRHDAGDCSLHMEFVPELFLGSFAVGNALQRAGHPDDVPRVIPDCLTSRSKPAVFA